jgi:hypothetical protein
MIRYIFTFATSLMCFFTLAQPYTEVHTRHRFAQLNLGIDQRFQPSTGTSLAGSPLPDLHTTNLIIGGTHFWGHADFFIAVPLIQNRLTHFRPRIETGAKIFPWRIEKHKLRPYMGISWQPAEFTYKDGPVKVRHQSPLLAGCVYQYRDLLFEAGGAFIPSGAMQYPTSLHQTATVKTAPLRFTMGIKWTFDGTIGAERDWQSGRTKLLTDTLASLRRLNSWTIGVGPSSAMYGAPQNHNSSLYPYLDEHRIGGVFPELTVGYYWHKPDIQVQFAYRYIATTQTAFGHEQRARRSVPAIEAFAFVADYHGFVPFIGTSLGYESYKLEDRLPGGDHNIYRDDALQPALLFGWDIRPNRLQILYLRTSLRWNPWSVLETKPGTSFSFAQLEVNFIQVVIMLNRL